MSYVLHLRDEPTRTLVVTALKAAAERSASVAIAAAAALREERQAGKDVRSRALKVADLLADVEQLRALAAALEGAQPEQDAPAPPAPVLGAAEPDPPHSPPGDTDLTVPLADETADLPDVETLDEEAPKPKPAPPRGPTAHGDAQPTGTGALLAQQLANMDAHLAQHDQGANP